MSGNSFGYGISISGNNNNVIKNNIGRDTLGELAENLAGWSENLGLAGWSENLGAGNEFTANTTN